MSAAQPSPSQTAPTKPGFVWLFFLGFWLLILIVLRSQPFNDPGALWHVKVGDWIFAHGTFPRTDPFTWSHADKAWIPQQWGAECLMSLAHRAGGFDALLMLMATVLAAAAAAIAKRFLDAGLHWMPAAGIVAFGMAVAGFHFYLRPHIATIVLMAIVMMWLVDFERGRIGMKRLLWLIPLCAVWTNLHGGVLGGIFTFGLALGGWLAFRCCSWRQVGYLSLIIAACALATLANPFGFEMHRTWWRILGSDVLKTYITEHQPLNLGRTDGQAVAAFGAFYVIMLAGTLPRMPRVTWLIPLAWLALSVTSIRHGPIFCMTALVALADLLPETVWFRLLKKYGDTFARAPALPSSIGWQGWSVPLAAVLLSLTLQVSRIAVPVIGYGWARFDPKMIPNEEMRAVLQEYAMTKPEGFPIFNDANLGGFLIYFAPNLRVFMDDRCELYGDDGIRDYIDMVHDHPERIEEWWARTQFDRALVESDSDMDKYLKKSERWQEVARCQKAAFYERVQ